MPSPGSQTPVPEEYVCPAGSANPDPRAAAAPLPPPWCHLSPSIIEPNCSHPRAALDGGFRGLPDAPSPPLPVTLATTVRKWAWPSRSPGWPRPGGAAPRCGGPRRTQRGADSVRARAGWAWGLGPRPAPGAPALLTERSLHHPLSQELGDLGAEVQLQDTQAFLSAGSPFLELRPSPPLPSVCPRCSSRASGFLSASAGKQPGPARG